jgi:hypothetical protein
LDLVGDPTLTGGGTVDAAVQKRPPGAVDIGAAGLAGSRPAPSTAHARRKSGRSVGRVPSSTKAQKEWDEAKRVVHGECVECIDLLHGLAASPSYHARGDMRAIAAKLQLAARWLEEVAGE